MNCRGLFLNKVLRPATLLKKRLRHMFSCEFFEFFKSNFFQRTHLVAASSPLIWMFHSRKTENRLSPTKKICFVSMKALK